nr:MAG TPA: Homeobox associated leucine zipper [Bacteriophage sp.]
MMNTRMVCIPKWQYEKMVESYDKVMKENWKLKAQINQMENGAERGCDQETH